MHRPRYDDWSFPKGKLDRDETYEQAARREVEEETGARGALGIELPSTTYVDGKGRDKTVRYWTMELEGQRPFEPNHEVDEVRWVDVDTAARMLSYGRDVDVLTSFRRALPRLHGQA